MQALGYIQRHGELSNVDLNVLLYLIDSHAAFLLDEPNVYKLTNHGLRQDIMLAATALSIPDHPRASEMLQTARRRLDEMANLLFTESGIWKEHAPGYVRYALRLLNDVRVLHKFSSDFNPELMLRNYDASLEYLLSSLMPGRRIPPVGQSQAEYVQEAIADADTIDKHLRNKSRTISAYMDYGHAIVREDDQDGTYLLFIASQNLPASKRHADELSIILYRWGRPWVTEGGAVTNKPGKTRDLLYSPFAHNNYVLDKEFVGASDEPDLAAGLLKAEETQSGYYVSGFSERFRKPARVEREIYVDGDFKGVRIVDSLTGRGSWVGRLQIPGDLALTIDGDTVVAMDPATGRQMQLVFSSDKPFRFSTCQGHPGFKCGWGQNPDGFGPVTSLRWATKHNVTIEIAISFLDNDA